MQNPVSLGGRAWDADRWCALASPGRSVLYDWSPTQQDYLPVKSTAINPPVDIWPYLEPWQMYPELPLRVLDLLQQAASPFDAAVFGLLLDVLRANTAGYVVADAQLATQAIRAGMKRLGESAEEADSIAMLVRDFTEHFLGSSYPLKPLANLRLFAHRYAGELGSEIVAYSIAQIAESFWRGDYRYDEMTWLHCVSALSRAGAPRGRVLSVIAQAYSEVEDPLINAAGADERWLADLGQRTLRKFLRTGKLITLSELRRRLRGNGGEYGPYIGDFPQGLNREINMMVAQYGLQACLAASARKGPSRTLSDPAGESDEALAATLYLVPSLWDDEEPPWPGSLRGELLGRYPSLIEAVFAPYDPEGIDRVVR